MTWGRILRRLRAELRLTGLAAWRGLVELVNSNDLTHAASIAYYALLSLFPVPAAHRLDSRLDHRRNDARMSVGERRPLLRLPVFPRAGAISSATSSMRSASRHARRRRRRRRAGARSGRSLGVFGAITSAVNEAWGVEKQRSFWKHRLVSFLMLVAAGGVMVIAFCSSLHDLAQRSSRRGRRRSLVRRHARALRLADRAADADASTTSPPSC